MPTLRIVINGLRDMGYSRQGDLFEREELERDDEDDSYENPNSPIFFAEPDDVRPDLHKMLAEARAAETMPWDAQRLLLYRTIFPQMTNWLPPEEAARLCSEFAAELARLEAREIKDCADDSEEQDSEEQNSEEEAEE